MRNREPALTTEKMARASSPRRSQLTFTKPTAKAARAPKEETLRKIQHIDFAHGKYQHALLRTQVSGNSER